MTVTCASVVHDTRNQQHAAEATQQHCTFHNTSMAPDEHYMSTELDKLLSDLFNSFNNKYPARLLRVLNQALTRSHRLLDMCLPLNKPEGKKQGRSQIASEDSRCNLVQSKYISLCTVLNMQPPCTKQLLGFPG